MSNRNYLRQLALGFFLIFTALNLSASVFPSKPIKIIVPFSPGGGSDVITRLLAEKMAGDLGVSVLVENKPGASSIIGTDVMAKSAPDGYTILMTNRAITVNPWLFKLPYDTAKLTPVMQLVGSPLLLVSSTKAPFKNLNELITYAKAYPGKVSIGNSGVGQLPHLAAVLFEKSSGVELTMVNYKGSGSSTTDLIGGQIDLSFGTVPSFMQQIKNKTLIPLGVSSTTRNPALPSVPSISEVLPGYDLISWFGFFAPPSTPKPIVDKLYQSISRALASPDLKARLNDEGLDVTALDPEKFKKVFAADLIFWQKFIKDNNIKIE
ncbi:tripartite tricarboxylate transporter substrate binding protein [Polynucleobacter sp. VK25]|uniref:Bug family tripartite tricarboxylate transporter substrate binding protein n=1 Tax=Polynucleobacter sp. VK25 TaxID=1758398 RepID=UPI001BFEBF61|nr:tripartite tricarboxylate transporter substrate binding protein [Polynucleobacter sp. VK25]QWD68334.1 tripartite tricarboxylate transporter substrate binding protein [Polynucleobacter sp. VK25]